MWKIYIPSTKQFKLILILLSMTSISYAVNLMQVNKWRSVISGKKNIQILQTEIKTGEEKEFLFKKKEFLFKINGPADKFFVSSYTNFVGDNLKNLHAEFFKSWILRQALHDADDAFQKWLYTIRKEKSDGLHEKSSEINNKSKKKPENNNIIPILEEQKDKVLKLNKRRKRQTELSNNQQIIEKLFNNQRPIGQRGMANSFLGKIGDGFKNLFTGATDMISGIGKVADILGQTMQGSIPQKAEQIVYGMAAATLFGGSVGGGGGGGGGGVVRNGGQVANEFARIRISMKANNFDLYKR